MSSLLPYQPSLASATNTRVDSACKHIQQCRVSTDDLLAFTVPRCDHEQLQRDKYRYCVHKDECVVGIGRPWAPQKYRKRQNNAYPRVTSNLGDMDAKNVDLVTPMKMIRYMAFYARSVRERMAIVDWFESGNHHDAHVRLEGDAANRQLTPAYEAFQASTEAGHAGKLGEGVGDPWLGILSDFTSVGYANTLGWAHPNSGDTMTSVMIGGLRTVMNGDFEIFTGDLIQWYWPFERDTFQNDGSRNPYIGRWTRAADGTLRPPNVDPKYTPDHIDEVQLSADASDREAYHSRQFGQPAGKLKMVARIKPYFRDDENPRLYDYHRVFAVAISCARPHEMVDIKIARQSL